MNITIFKVMWRHLKRFNAREQLQRVLADGHKSARKAAEEALQMLSEKEKVVAIVARGWPQKKRTTYIYRSLLFEMVFFT